MTKQDNSKPQANPAQSAAAPSAALGPTPASGPAVPAAVQDPETPREGKSSDWFVIASIAIVSVAISVMSFSQLKLSLAISGVAGVTALALLMLIHKQMQKSAQIAQLKAELAQSRQRPKAPAPAQAQARAAPATASSPVSTEERIRELSRDIGNLVPRSDAGGVSDQTSMHPASPPSIAALAAGDRGQRRPLRAPVQPNAEIPVKPATETNAASPVASLPAGDAPTAGPQPPQGEPSREQWSFRPRTGNQASAPDASAATNVINVGGQAHSAPKVMTVEGDLELVQRKIKELADEVNAAEALRPKQLRVSPRPKEPTNALEDSIGALRAAAKNMRGRPTLGDFIPKFEAQAFAPQPASVAVPAATPVPAQSNEGFGELVIPATAERIAGSDLAAPTPSFGDRDVAPPSLELPLPNFAAPTRPVLSPRSAAIARAVEDDSVELLLGPIVTLAEHSVSHYEMVAGLRSEAGESLDFNEDDFAQIGDDLDAHFDVARLNRAAALAARMDAREREGSLLAEFLGSSMTSRAFLEAFASAYESRQRIAQQLVLTFSQRAVDEFSPSAWQAVRDMHAFGFRLALDKVRHMGTDFTALQRSGFRFVRFDAQILLEGLATPERFVPADEILQRSTLAGLSIIAGGIQDAAAQKRLLDSGILLGQGPLFGAPRQVNVDGGAGPTEQSSGSAAAA
ncbi:EAL domain-containing protein [Hyphomicrobium sp.]|uniref:EAL domain-containing protein n=1 Tax=Hyphomicrobium sp. TaxID=82 RepID=UPI003569991D